jgi:biopolymer transport protein ExbD
VAGKINHIDDGLVENHEINVTPFIDVMLVLLVIFMITAPLSTVDIPVKLPVANAEQTRPPDKPVYVTLQADGIVAVGNDRVSHSQIPAALARITQGNRDSQLFLRADKSVRYERLMDLLNVLRNAGYLKVALVGIQSGTAGASSDATP